MRYYQINNQIIITDEPIPTGEELTANTTDGAYEKHVPQITQTGDHVTVKVGSVPHPMLDVHYIEWIVLQTKNGVQRAELKPGDAPKAVFALVPGDEVEAAYAYCNLHSLWKG